MAYQSEIEKLERRYQENPDQWFAALADQYRKSGSMELALQVVRAGLEKRPNYVSGHIVLGRCLLDQKNDAEASKVFQRVLELDSENIMALKTLAEIGERTGDADGARRWLGRLLEIDPMNDEAREAMAKLPAGEAPPPPAAPVAAPPAPAGAVEGFEATSFADIAPPEAAPVSEVAPSTPVTAAPAPAAAVASVESLEIERTDGEGVASAELPTLELEPSSTEISVVAQPAEPAEDMVPLEREDLITLEPTDAAPAAPEVLPLDDSVSGGGADAALGIEPMPVVELDAPPPLELESTLPEPAPLVTAGMAEPAPLVTSGTAEEVAALPVGAEPEPVLTETMAEVYARQGLVDQARGVYQQLLRQRPGDERLQRRLQELTPQRAPVADAAGPARTRRPTAAATGGVSARAFISGILTGRSVPAVPLASTPMDAAFAAEPPGGAPTAPAADEATLASVFPDEGGVAERPAGGGGGAGAFSFDEFFGGRRQSRPSTPRANPTGSPGGEDDFKSWLKGLKT